MPRTNHCWTQSCNIHTKLGRDIWLRHLTLWNKYVKYLFDRYNTCIITLVIQVQSWVHGFYSIDPWLDLDNELISYVNQINLFPMSNQGCFTFSGYTIYVLNALWRHVIFLQVKSGVQKFTPSMLANQILCYKLHRK